jgi:hypothetical protein
MEYFHKDGEVFKYKCSWCGKIVDHVWTAKKGTQYLNPIHNYGKCKEEQLNLF